MNDSQILTESQLDAALAEQRSQRIAKLRRRVRFPFHWILVAVAVGVIFDVAAYFVDRHSASLVGAFSLIAVGIFGYASHGKRRLRAQLELERAFEAEARLPPNKQLQRTGHG